MQEADLAAAPMTVSDERREAVDFTDPFMNFGSEILMKKPGAASDGSTTQIPPLPTITSVRDLAHQTVIKYGVIQNGRTADFFRKSTDPAYKVMWDEMSNNPDYGMVAKTKIGVDRVRQSDGRYAFITEGTTADYWVHQQPCDLVSVDGKMDQRSYALAVRRGSPLKARLDAALGQMKAAGELDRLRQKWWIEKSQCGAANGFISSSRSLVIALPIAFIAVAFPLL